MATWIKTTGEMIDVEPKNKRRFSLEELQGFVGGYIEMVRLAGGQLMVCNEEGKLHGLPHNARATGIAILAGLNQTIVGDVLVGRKGEM